MEKIIGAEELERYLNVGPILDVRSPAEYEEDHVPGAINIPVLTNEQRIEVGTLYKTNAFEAKKLGAAYITLAIHHFLQSDLIKDASKATRFVIYCARGGQRSGSLGAVLHQVGYPVFRYERGYKSYREYLLNRLNGPIPGPIYVLYGYTGSGKTWIINQLRDDVNVLDLEGLANHRGSLLGNMAGGQPGQRAFETELCSRLRELDPNKPTVIEGESRKIGLINLPNGVYEQMKAAKHLWVDIPREQRRDYILRDYGDMEVPYFMERLDKLKQYLPGPAMDAILEELKTENRPRIVELLLEHHYDPLYDRPNKKGNRERLDASTIEGAVEVLRRRILDGCP